jgi:hypothetical protein
MCRVQNDSPIHVLNANMFCTPSNTFEFPSYAAQLANVLAEAPSPPPIRTRPFKKLVLDFLDIEAEQGEDSDRHASPHVVMTHSPGNSSRAESGKYRFYRVIFGEAVPISVELEIV